MEAYKRMTRPHGVKVQSYHNGIFRANKFIEWCVRKGRPITFAGVDAHFQNGICERRIRELQDSTRTQLKHAARRWKGMITDELWPLAMQNANDLFNEFPNLNDSHKHSPLQVFSGSNIQPNKKHRQPFGCPAYVLETPLRSAGGIWNKWRDRARVGVYKTFPLHSKSIALILYTETGHVSPQFHVKFDPQLITV